MHEQNLHPPPFLQGAPLSFPAASRADAYGLLALGGDLSPARLVAAYRRGIFPMYRQGEPIQWWCPDPRAVLFPPRLHIPRSLAKILRRGVFRTTMDEALPEVIAQCAAPRKDSSDSWLTEEMQAAYIALHDEGIVHSWEVWCDGELAGGVYGVTIGAIFFAESMFSRRSNAGKTALVTLLRQLEAWGYVLLDCQLPSLHTTALGAVQLRRAAFLRILQGHIDDSLPASWRHKTTAL